MPIISLELERNAIGGLIRNPQIFYEIDGYVSEHDFYNEIHRTIYSVVKNTLIKGEKIDKVLIGEKIKNLGFKFKQDINIGEYLSDISFSPIAAAQTIKYFKELSLYRVRREISEIAENIKGSMEKGEYSSFNDIIAKSDSLYNKTIKSYTDIDAPQNLFEGLYEKIQEMGNNPINEFGIETPFPSFNKFYGHLRASNLYAIASRAGCGKSSVLSDIAFGCHQINPKIQVLYLDTEMSFEEQQFRRAASISGVPLWYIETGNFRKNQDLFDKVKNSLSEVNKYKFYHYQVANKNIDEVCSIIRRWYYSKCGRGNPCIIIYDYVKLTGEKIGENWAEHQAMGSKIDKLKRISEEVKSPLFTAIQMNRSGESANKNSSNVIDDSSAFALTDRLQWFASFTAIFRPKTLDEIALDGEHFGTHKMIATKTRWQGKEAAGFSDYVKRKFPDGTERYVKNYLNFEVKNFKVTEKGSLQDIVDGGDMTPDISDGKQKGVMLD